MTDPGGMQPPRPAADLFSISQLEHHAQVLATSHQIGPARWRNSSGLLTRLAANQRVLGDANDMLAQAVKARRRITPAAEWFIDNYHLVEDQIRTARRHLPHGFAGELPQLCNGPTAGTPRVYDLMLELISHSHGRIEEQESLHAFVVAYQESSPLSLGELWAIPIMLRLALLENLRWLMTGVTAARRERELAGVWVERMLEVAETDPSQVVLVVADMIQQAPPLTDPFVAELASRLQGQGPALVFATSWIEHRLAERGLTAALVFQRASRSQAADQVAVSNTIGSLRFLGNADWRNFVETMSVVEQTLRTDPTGQYALMDVNTRDAYRHAVEEIARNSPQSQSDVAAEAVQLSRIAETGRAAHVGNFLIGTGRDRLERTVKMRRGARLAIARGARRMGLPLYVAVIALLTAAIAVPMTVAASFAGLATSGVVLLTLLLVIAGSQLAGAIVQWTATHLVRPSVLPRLDFTAGIPAAHHTLVAVPTMLTDAAEIDRLLESLEVRHLANPDEYLSLALITDFRDADSERLSGDESLLKRATDGVEALNRARAVDGQVPPFFLLHRARRWNPSENVWMGWERKRGKLEQLNSALRGDPSGFDTIVGDLSTLQDVKYVIALDSDTQLSRDSASELAGAMAHPLNRPQFDATAGRVTAGYTILQPRVVITMASARRSRFARLFATEPGIDPYSRAVSDVYQDVFGEGSFIGKGIYDVDAFMQSTAGRLPENRILSHDLLEGAYARTGLISDVLILEDFPSNYAADVSRRNRWTRGDWQIVPWLGSRVPGPDGKRTRNPISMLSRWKIFDNLRRSMVPIALLTLLFGGWATTVANAPLVMTLVVIAMLVIPAVLSAAVGLTRRPSEMPRVHRGAEIARSLGHQLLREGFLLATLPADAFNNLVAICRTAWRLLTGSRLLEWCTAADAQRSARKSLLAFYWSLSTAPLAAAAGATIVWLNPHAFPAAIPVLVLWLVAPALTWWLSRPIEMRPTTLRDKDVQFLRMVARRTWSYFDTFVGPSDHYLAPDNFQEDPPQGIAHRTSPTNIGLTMTATLAACDFGYIPVHHLIDRTKRTLDSLDRLEQFRGHFFNWYDTATLEPLQPRYVSTVDSGNLAGHLLTLAAGLDELRNQPTVRVEHLFAGLTDTVNVMMDAATNAAARAHATRLHDLLRDVPTTISGGVERLRRLLDKPLQTIDANGGATWSGGFDVQCRRGVDELIRMAPWVDLLSSDGAGELREFAAALDVSPTLQQSGQLTFTIIPAIDRAISTADSRPEGDERRTRLERLRDAVVLGSERATQRIDALNDLAVRCAGLANVDYEFLYNRTRHLLAIGYNVTEHRLDASYYDLLASEARLASFVAIAHGELPQENWFRLGRLLTNSMGRPALLSWSGSMFEYLMPMLIMPTHEGTVLGETCRGVVQRQIEYGNKRGVPWGVSESGYYKTDAAFNYQYRAFGVPGLGFKRGLADDLVIAPYASALALMVDARAACDNLQRLRDDGRLGVHGFYEAIDYTPSRLPRGKTSITVQSYMAHHQGMTLLALASSLLGQPMQRRFESDPSFRATELLLQERVPRTRSLVPHPAEVSASGDGLGEAVQHIRVFTTADTSVPEVQLLSNGNYHVAVTNSGGGYSRWNNLAVTRWHEDPTRDCWGSFCYLRDLTTGSFWSAAHQPTLLSADRYEAIFSLGRAEFRRRDRGIDTHVEISVSPEDDVELRRVSLTNTGRTARTIELTSYAEVVLATAAADAAHPAFSNLFVQTEIVRDRQAILCSRRPRSNDEHVPWLFHLMTVNGAQSGTTSYDTSRDNFIGRGRTIEDPVAMHLPGLTDSEGSVLDPIAAIRNAVAIQPNEEVRIHLVTGVASSRTAAIALIDKYRDRHSAERVFELSWTHNQVLLRRLDATEGDNRLFESLVSHVLYSNATMRAPHRTIARNDAGQSSLWAHSMSGDLPIVLVRVTDGDQMHIVRQMVQAHACWRLKGVAVDLVIWNETPSGYRQLLHDEIVRVIATVNESSVLDRPGGIFVRRIDQLPEADKVLMQTVARVIVNAGDGSIAEQLNRRMPIANTAPPFAGTLERAPGAVNRNGAVTTSEEPDLSAFNGLGGFTQDGREYIITTTRESRTPAPWANVLANPHFGTVVTESGGSCTWCENARLYRLTPWHNDPVTDASGEAFYLRDQDDGRYWSPTALPAGGPGPYTTRHGFGYSVFEYACDGISSSMQTFVATDAPTKFMVFKLRNTSGRTRRLSLLACFELVLGEDRPINRPHVVTELDAGSGALLARNSYSGEFPSRVAFLDCSMATRSVSGDRREVIGRNGSPARPAGLNQAWLSGRVGAGFDPCLAMQVEVELADGQQREIVFTFGSGRNLTDARTLVHRFRGVAAARSALELVVAFWKRMLGAVQVDTPDASLNALANGWLLYQTLAARMWGRAGFYQSGGAYGFRDQLQDAMALVHARPALLREQILRCAARQFPEGDVQHWWHPPHGRGVRTHISDDYLFLTYAVCRYVNAIGDTGVLDEAVGFLEGRAVESGEDSYYDMPGHSDLSATLYDHCVRAIRHGLRFGAHGLPLMGSGDWNDGMNSVGEKGKGESVWLAFFLYDVLVTFAGVAEQRDDVVFAEECRNAAAQLSTNVREHAWDGEWYRRAWTDEGEVLGSASSPECQIDSLSQSWAVLSGMSGTKRSKQALDSLDRRLVRRDLGLVMLFDPPFDKSDLEPGYVKGYVPGVRENGAQYTHAAIWAAMAFAAQGDAERAWELFDMINPVRHGDSSESIATYKVEPYVMAADVYTNPQHAGRGGWTWYTGSAAWMYRLIVESLLGLRLNVDRLHIEPLMPADWPSFDVQYRHRDAVYHIHVRNLGSGGRTVSRVTCDGAEQPDHAVPLHSDDGVHLVRVDVGDA